MTFGRQPPSGPPEATTPATSGEVGRGPDSASSAPKGSWTDEPHLDDATLVRQSLVDAEAFGVLYDRYCDRIYRFVLHRLRDRAAAEDVTTEVFIKAMRGLGSYRPHVAPFSAWLYRIAANAAIDHMRSRRVTEPLEEGLDLVDTSEAIEDQVIRRVDASGAWAVLDRLTDAQRLAVTLRLAHDLTIAEIAKRLNRSEGAVKLLLNRGLATARLHLTDAAQADGFAPSPGEESPA